MSDTFIEAASYGISPAQTPAFNATKYQQAVNDAIAGYKTLLLAPGGCPINQSINLSGGLKMVGTGIIAGSSWGSAIQPVGDFPALVVNTNDPVVMTDFSVIQPANSLSACIDVTGPVCNYYSRFERLRVTGGIGFHFRMTSNWTVRSCIGIACKINVIRIQQSGDSTIDDLIANGVEGDNPQVFCDGLGNWAGLRFVNSKTNGGGYGFKGHWGNFSDGDLLIANNSIEGCSQAGVMIQRSGTGRFGTINISNNLDIGTAGRAIYIPTDPKYTPAEGPWLNDVVIANNILIGGVAVVDIDCVGRGKFIGNRGFGAPWGLIVSRKCRDWTVDLSGMDGQHDLSCANLKKYVVQ